MEIYIPEIPKADLPDQAWATFNQFGQPGRTRKALEIT